MYEQHYYFLPYNSHIREFDSSELYCGLFHVFLEHDVDMQKMAERTCGAQEGHIFVRQSYLNPFLAHVLIAGEIIVLIFGLSIGLGR